MDDLTDIARRTVEGRYVLDGLSALQHDVLLGSITTDVTIAMAALQVLGAAVLDREANTAELTELGRFAVRRVRRMAQPGDPVLQLRVTLADVDSPPVWRRLVIPADYTLDRVHGVIQAAMGWENCHLHMFRIAGHEYDPAYLGDDIGALDESQFRLGDLMKRRKLARYEYDFGDSWEHELAVEAQCGRCRHGVSGLHRRRRRVPARRLRRCLRVCRPRRGARRGAEPRTRGDAGVGWRLRPRALRRGRG